MIQIRLRMPCRREFAQDVYRPGVISISRILWGSLGGGVALAVIVVMSVGCGVPVLYPPLAATCFINAACVYLRVARPRQVIVGHLVSSVAGLLAVWSGDVLVGVVFDAQNSFMLLPFKLGMAVALSAVFMQIFDADHPPAAATAAIPAILPLPMAPLLLPLHMAWGGVIAVLVALAWNRVWFAYPSQEGEACPKCLGLYLNRRETAGLVVCVLAALAMALRPLSVFMYHVGLGVMLLGGVMLMLQHFAEATVSCGAKDGN